MSDLQLYVDLAAEPIVVYDCWLHSVHPGTFTEAFASIDPRTDGKYKLWGGVVTGHFISLDRPRKVIQSWRTSEFPSYQASSTVTLDFKPHKGETRLLITHEQIPQKLLEQFRYGWEEFYFPRMQFYFSSNQL